MKTAVVFEQGITIAGITVSSISDDSDVVWYIEKQPHGVEVVTYDKGTVLVPWHNIKYVRFTG